MSVNEQSLHDGEIDCTLKVVVIDETKPPAREIPFRKLVPIVISGDSCPRRADFSCQSAAFGKTPLLHAKAFRCDDRQKPTQKARLAGGPFGYFGMIVEMPGASFPGITRPLYPIQPGLRSLKRSQSGNQIL